MKTAEEIRERIVQAHIESINWDEGNFNLLRKNIDEGLEEYRSQHQDLPSDDEIETYEHDVTNKYGATMSNHQTDDGFAGWEIGMKQMRSIASPLLASRDARIRELEEENQKLKEYINPPKKDSFFDGLKVGQRD